MEHATIGRWAWLRADEVGLRLPTIQKNLTVVPKATSEYSKPTTLRLWEEDRERGLIGVPREWFLANRKREYEIVHDHAPDAPAFLSSPFAAREKPLRDEQRKALAAFLRAFRDDGKIGGILQAPTGWGKTTWALALLAELRLRALVLVHKEFLMSQWEERAHEFLPGVRVGFIQGDRCDVDADLCIGMIQSLSQREYPPEVYRAFSVVASDECVYGDALVETDEGAVPLKDVVGGRAKLALSFDESCRAWRYAKILRRMRRGVRETVVVRLANGKALRMTANHPVMTAGGWVQAGNLRTGHQVLCPVPVDVDTRHKSRAYGESRNTMSSGTKTVSERGWTGHPVLTKSTPQHPSVPADAVSDCASAPILFGSRGSRLCGGGRFYQATTIASERSSVLEKAFFLSSLEPYSEMAVSHSPTELPPSPDCRSSMAHAKKRGLDTKHGDFSPFDSPPSSDRTGDLGLSPFGVPRRAILTCCLSTDLPDRRGEKSGSAASGWRGYRTKPSRGGTWTMGVTRGSTGNSFSTQRGTRNPKTDSSLRGSTGVGIGRPLTDTRGGIGTCDSIPIRPVGSSIGCGATPFRRWRTSFASVESVEPSSPVEVFDLEVEGNHNFVADGVLVHNCHRVSAATWASVVPKFHARLRLGITATPRRKDCAESVFLWHIGPILFRARHLPMEPAIRWVRTGFDFVRVSGQPSMETRPRAIQLRVLCANDPRNNLIAEELAQAVSFGRKVIVLSERLNHLHRIARLFDADPRCKGASWAYYVGGMEEAALEESAKARVIFATSQMASEGLDIPELDTLMLVTPTSDPEQAVGRILRAVPGKQQPIVVDFVDGIKWCERLAEKREAVYSRLRTLAAATPPVPRPELPAGASLTGAA